MRSCWGGMIHLHALSAEQLERERAAEERFRQAKEKFSLACAVMLKSQPEAERLVADALREFEAARAAMRGKS